VLSRLAQPSLYDDKSEQTCATLITNAWVGHYRAKSFDYFRDQLSAQMPHPRDPQESSEDIFERFRRITAVMKMALTSSSGRTSPGGSTFQLATGSGRTVSLLQDLPLPKLNGINGDDRSHAPWKLKPTFDLNSHQFPWRFLSGTV
jgi:hypothetical protein